MKKLYYLFFKLNQLVARMGPILAGPLPFYFYKIDFGYKQYLEKPI